MRLELREVDKIRVTLEKKLKRLHRSKDVFVSIDINSTRFGWNVSIFAMVNNEVVGFHDKNWFSVTDTKPLGRALDEFWQDYNKRMKSV